MQLFILGYLWSLKVQLTLPEANVVVVVVIAVLSFYVNVVAMALLVVTDPIVNICGQ